MIRVSQLKLPVEHSEEQFYQKIEKSLKIIDTSDLLIYILNNNEEITEEEKEILEKPGKLVCLKCGRFIPLECSRLEAFFDHISEEHGFELDRHHMILYGYCGCCKNEKNSRDFA